MSEITAEVRREGMDETPQRDLEQRVAILEEMMAVLMGYRAAEDELWGAWVASLDLPDRPPAGATER